VKPCRFGVHVIGPSGRDEWESTARQAESSGFAVMTVPDHLIDGCMSPFAALGIAGEATSTLRLGTLVLNCGLRHPALVAREALALDVLSGGRVELGLGAGSAMSAPEHASSGVAFDRAPVRIARLAETVAVLDGLLRGESVTFEGTHHRLEDHHAWPPPVQAPRPPLLVGGSGRRVLATAAARADIVSLSAGITVSSDGGKPTISRFGASAVDEQIGIVRAISRSRDVELHALVQRVIVTDDRQAAAERVVEHISAVTVDDVLGSPYLWIGTVDEICEQVLAARDRWGISYFSVFSDALEAAAPIVARLASAE
jgi:probable F420-dependent oxidoreductase